MLGAFTEMGPYVFKDGQKTMTKNNNSWTNLASMVFIESPCTVGFSYCTGFNSTYANDNSTADDNLQAVLSFFKKYPEFKENDFYVAGESYAGIYVPYLAYWIHNYNNDKNTLPGVKINLQGWIVGNAVTNWDYDGELANIDWLYYHAMYSPQDRPLIAEYCQGSNISKTAHACDYFTKTVENPLFNNDKINRYDLNGFCYSGSSKTYDPFPGKRRRMREMAQKDNQNAENLNEILGETPSCLDASGVNAYFNNATIRKELHIPDTLSRNVWSECSEELNYDEAGSIGSFWIYKELIPLQQYKILVYSGDTDASVSTLGTQRWLDRLRVEMAGSFYMLKTWAPWLFPSEVLYNPQLGGYATVFNGLTFVTVRGAGHMVPQWRPYQSYIMLHYWLEDIPFDTYPMTTFKGW